MNIVLFTDTYPPFINGVSTSCYNLAKTLREHGHRVLVICPLAENGKLKRVDDTIYIPGLEMKKLYGYRMTTIYSRKVMKMIIDFKPDVLHNQTDATIGIFAKICARKLKMPYVYTYHTAYEDYTHYASHGFLDRIFKHIVRFYTRQISNHSTEFITPSEKTKDYMRFSRSDIHINVIPTGIDFSLFGKDKVDYEKQAAFKKEHNIGEKTKLFLILGRVAKEKSMDVSIRGFAKYHETYPNEDVKLIVVGDGPSAPELKLLVKELGIEDYVDFIGAVPASEVPFYYRLADIYTSASITETQGLTFMEAMSAEAVVLARFDSNLNNTIIDGETGYFFTDEDSFVKKAHLILTMSEEEKKRITDKALEIVDMYSMERFYQNILGVYNRAIKKCW